MITNVVFWYSNISPKIFNCYVQCTYMYHEHTKLVYLKLIQNIHDIDIDNIIVIYNQHKSLYANYDYLAKHYCLTYMYNNNHYNIIYMSCPVIMMSLKS